MKCRFGGRLGYLTRLFPTNDAAFYFFGIQEESPTNVMVLVSEVWLCAHHSNKPHCIEEQGSCMVINN